MPELHEALYDPTDPPDFIRVLDLHLCSNDVLHKLAMSVEWELAKRDSYEKGGLLTDAELAAIRSGRT